MNQGNPPPNWYPDPRGEAELRYWDGNQWTEHTHSGQQAGGETVAAQVPQSAPPPSTAPPPQAAPPTAASAAGPQGAYGPGPSGPTGPAPSGGGGKGKLPLIIGGAVAAVVLLIVLGVVLLGGGEEKTDEDRVRETAEEILTTEDTGACRELATQDYVEKATGQEGEAAFKACEEDPGQLSESSDISNVEVDGSQATVEAKTEGGQLDGEDVELSLLEQEGEWKLDDLTRPALLEGEKAEPAVLNTVLNFGSSEGPKACAYLSFSKLQELGGVSGCEKEFANATSANYSPEDASITGTDATVTVTESKQNKTIKFTLKHEAGNWKIANFEQAS